MVLEKWALAGEITVASPLLYECVFSLHHF